MPQGLSQAALGILHLSLLLTVALFLPLILQLLLLFTAGWIFGRMVSKVSQPLTRLLVLIGTPVHEFSHALALLITLCRVVEIKPLPDKEPGHVAVTQCNPVGNLASSVAPLFGGALVLWLTASYVIPGFTIPTIVPPQMDLESAASLGTVLRESAAYLGRFLQTAYSSLPDLQWDNWRTYVGLYIALSVGIEIAPSPSDVVNFAKGLPLILAMMLLLAAWLYLAGDAQSGFLTLQEGLVPHLLNFLTAVTYAFVLVSLGVFVFLPLRLWQKLREQVAEDEETSQATDE